VTVASDGSIEPVAGCSLDEQKQFDNWLQSACEHPGGILLSHRLGNLALVGVIRDTLARTPDLYPILLDRVVYSGSHTGDSLGIDLFEQLSGELDALARAQTREPAEAECLRSFGTQVRDLLEAGRRLNRPIVF